MNKKQAMHLSNKGGMARECREEGVSAGIVDSYITQKLRHDIDVAMLSGPVRVFTREEILNYGGHT